MHTLGKVLMAFVIIGALAGTYLAARLLDTRAQWMAQVEERSEQYQQRVRELEDARRRAIDRENEVNRLQFAAGSYWTAPNSSPAQGATIGLGIGGNAGLVQDTKTHLFHVNDEGVSQYLGEFVLDTVQGDIAGATLTRAPYPQETQDWQQMQGTFRVRRAIPSPWGEEFATLWSEYGTTLQKFESETAMLRRQQEALAAATTQLDERMQELQGHPDAPEDADVVEKEGIVEAMRLAEVARDITLEQLDALRREYSAKWYELKDMLDANRERRELLGEVSPQTEEPVDISQLP